MKYLIILLPLLVACGDRDLGRTGQIAPTEDYEAVKESMLGLFEIQTELNQCEDDMPFISLPELFYGDLVPQEHTQTYEPETHLMDPVNRVLIRLRPTLESIHQLVLLNRGLRPSFPLNFKRIDNNLYLVTLPFDCGEATYKLTPLE